MEKYFPHAVILKKALETIDSAIVSRALTNSFHAMSARQKGYPVDRGQFYRQKGYPVDKGHSCGQKGYSMDRRNVPTKKEAYPNPALPVRDF